MRRKRVVQEIVEALLGVWAGGGSGGYPTIDSFQYRERLAITERDDHPALHYDQRTWKLTTEGEVVSHWETGLLRLSSDGTVVFNNAQPGRAEAMKGTWRGDTATGWVIELASDGYGGDQRVVRSTRTIRCDGTTLQYRMLMETSSTNANHPHLEATLTREAG